MRARESAIVPVATHELEARKVLLFDQKENSVRVRLPRPVCMHGGLPLRADHDYAQINAMQAVHLYNTSTSVLANGSLSLMEGGRFVSQVDLTPLFPNEDALIP